MTYSYRAPERLEDDWRSGNKTPPGEMLEELRGDIENVKGLAAAGAPLVPIQGRVSDYKSWLAAAVAMELAGSGTTTTVFAPQRTNRQSAVEKLQLFGAELMEHPGRLDLCIWERWRESVGRVDKSTCESIGCPYYLDSEEDIADRTSEALSSHLLTNGGDFELTTEVMKALGETQDFCPAQLYLQARTEDSLSGLVNVATYAKAFEEAAMAADDPLGSDVVLLDEAHTISANPDVIAHTVEPDKLTSSVETVCGFLEGSAERWAQRALREVADLREALTYWLDRSEEQHVEPNEIFAGDTVTLARAFEALETVDSRIMQSVRRRLQTDDMERVQELSGPLACTEAMRGFLSRVKQYRDGDTDFVHSRYEENGESVNEMAFRSVDETVDTAEVTTPLEVYRAWEERGTHPAIAERWGPILDRYIESLWEGRAVYTQNEWPGAPLMPMERLRSIAGADTVVALSATHNELSDPTRDGGDMRPTRHRLVCAPVHLRARGPGRQDYSGSDSVSPDTPWFADMVREAKERSGDRLAAVPINYQNRLKWEDLPVESLENEDGEPVPGIVPNSRGSIGEKGLEELDIDTVLCGVQVQGPAPTARRLVQWWEMLAPRSDGPVDALETSWKLLAQHAVSGTIQAGGRFDWGATNLVFERPGLFELAGFECVMADPDQAGFAGAFASVYKETRERWEKNRAGVRAARVVDYLNSQERKTATLKQSVSQYQRMYGADEQEARDSLRKALEAGTLAGERRDNGPVRLITTQ